MLVSINNKGQLVVITHYGSERIHVNHCSSSIEDLKEETANLYIVVEECTNFGRIHLMAAFSQDEAAQKVWEYLQEKEDSDEFHLIAVFDVQA